MVSNFFNLNHINPDTHTHTHAHTGPRSALQIDEIYHTPTGPILVANVISEIVITIPYNVFAFVGSLMLLLCPRDVAPELRIQETNVAALIID